jgi:hypothetical protein
VEKRRGGERVNRSFILGKDIPNSPLKLSQSPLLSFSPHTIHRVVFLYMFHTEQKGVFILKTPREREILVA